MTAFWGHESWGVVARMNPQTLANTALLTDAVDMSLYHEIMAILLTGDMANETLDFKLQDSATSGGTYADITGKAITQQAASATANDNNQYIISCRSDQMNAGARYLKARAVTGGATGGPSCILILGRAAHKPAKDKQLSSVKTIVT